MSISYLCLYEVNTIIGINYAGEPWVSMPWRFIIINNAKN